MKHGIVVSALTVALAFAACSRDYSKDLVGTWDAGKATLEKNMTVVIKSDGTMTAEIKDLDMKPIKGTYRLDGNSLVFKLSLFNLSYTISRLDRKVLVMKNKYARITWNRIE
ncbi:MAG TPA: hypothetical protein PLM53_19250 [Spirochaetota bacterium]|nr:hypothetical protein [Spirochaetota bacterium]HPC39645.1 hypothetical protein [Spirochaetota bacterium]HPL18664.1 hypothetical protein [Spirochaetota bacterium]HQF07372.1 hypothetical protein [Spirochaetota bacterium]HQH99229.1 hypothetical protein [Spirochaetota bacterium]